MKHRYLFLSTIFLMTLGIVLQSNVNGPASNNNRATGAPGDGPNVCTSCHTGGSFGQVSIDFSLTDADGNEVTKYNADSVYTISVSVSAANGDPSGYGFQIIGIEDSNETTLSGFANPGSGVQLSTSSGRQYAEHNSPSATGEFTVEWTAPSEGTGDVTFYLGANAVNGNVNNTLDNAVLDDFTFQEEVIDDGFPEGVLEAFDQPAAFKVYPNPVDDHLNVVFNYQTSALSIYDISGKFVRTIPSRVLVTDVGDLDAGFYMITDGQHTTKFLKR